jgi:hypothetical protein
MPLVRHSCADARASGNAAGNGSSGTCCAHIQTGPAAPVRFTDDLIEAAAPDDSIVLGGPEDLSVN